MKKALLTFIPKATFKTKALLTFFPKAVEPQKCKKPVLKLHSTFVPQSFVENFPHWESHLYTNQTRIKA